MEFDHEKLIVHVDSVNPRTERHGEEEKLAADLGVRLMKAENEEVWDQIIVEVFHGQEDALAIIESMSHHVSKLQFNASCGDSKVNVWQGNRKPAAMVQAKINKFTWETKDGAQFLGIRIQALMEGETVGALAELIGQKIRLETRVLQTEMDLSDDDQGEGEE